MRNIINRNQKSYSNPIRTRQLQHRNLEKSRILHSNFNFNEKFIHKILRNRENNISYQTPVINRQQADTNSIVWSQIPLKGKRILWYGKLIRLRILQKKHSANRGHIIKIGEGNLISRAQFNKKTIHKLHSKYHHQNAIILLASILP